MFDDSSAPVTRILARLDRCVDQLQALDLSALDEPVLLGLMRGLERHRRRLPAIDHALITESAERGLPARYGCRNTTELLRSVLRISATDARHRVRAAGSLGARRTITGQSLAPERPHTAAAQAAGELSPDHAQVITRTLHELPESLRVDHYDAIESTLVTAAAQLDPDHLTVLGRRILDHLNPDGHKLTDYDHQRLRGATLFGSRDGSGILKARLTPEAFNVCKTVLGPLTAPRPADADGADPRTHGERLHDALLDACRRLLASGTLPDTGGIPTRLVITIEEKTWAAQAGSGSAPPATPRSGPTGDGGRGVSDRRFGAREGAHRRCAGTATGPYNEPVDISTAMRLTNQADVVSVLLNTAGGITSYGRDRRYATGAQRTALAARDRGCSFPGCDYPPPWTQAHHVRDWADGGCTDVENMTLLCGFHHRSFHTYGWTVHIRDGVPWWTPPPWIDSGRTPIRNTMHHSTTDLLPRLRSDLRRPTRTRCEPPAATPNVAPNSRTRPDHRLALSRPSRLITGIVTGGAVDRRWRSARRSPDP